MASDPVVRIEALRKLSLRGVDLSVVAGERVAVIGRSGAGKTVLLRCLLGLLPPHSGTVTLSGAMAPGHAGRRQALGVAFQQPGLFDAWTIRENLAVAGLAAPGEAELRGLLDAIGMEDVPLDAYPGALSGGQQKRVALLRAWLRGERVLVLDEPTSGLDPETGALVVRFLRDRLREDSRAVLLVTHDYELALALCDRVLILENGVLRELSLVDPPNGESQEQRLRRELAAERGTRGQPPLRRDRPLRWGFGPILWDFLARGLPLTLLAMAGLGFMLVIQSTATSRVDVSRYVPGVVVVGVFRELAPLVVGLLLASRIGARISAELGGMSYTAQLDSMRVMGISPLRHLAIPFAAAAALTFPVCILAGAYLSVAAGGGAVGIGLTGLHIGTSRFFILAGEAVDPRLVASCVVKGVLMGFLVVSLAYRIGSRPVAAAASLGRLVTSAAVTGALGIILVDIVVSLVFFTGGVP